MSSPHRPLDPRSGLVLDTHELGRHAGAMKVVRTTVEAPADLGIAVIGVDHAVGKDEATRLRDAHAQRSGARHHLRRRRDVRVPRQPVEPAQLVDQVEVEPPERGQHRGCGQLLRIVLRALLSLKDLGHARVPSEQ